MKMRLECITCLKFGGCIADWQTVGECPYKKENDD